MNRDALLPWSEVDAASTTPSLQPAAVLGWVIGIVALSVALLAILLKWFWPKKPSPPLTPMEHALRELDRIEGLGRAGPDESGWYPEEISSVIRRFLSERYGLPAQEQTTAEFLQTMRQTPELTEELQQTLKDLLARCDLAKFAALRTPPDECRRIAELARKIVQMVNPRLRGSRWSPWALARRPSRAKDPALEGRLVARVVL